ncbi:MAG: PIN domain nuclease [Elusimicrobiota bacterium]
MNPEQILIDTSAWIASFKKAGSPQLKEFLKNSILAGLAVTSPIIILELLQGCRTLKERDALKTKLESLDILSITPSVWERSYELAFSLRKKGLTIPTADLIIAASAIENNSVIIHHDEHFEMIAQHYPRLQTKHFGLSA